MCSTNHTEEYVKSLVLGYLSKLDNITLATMFQRKTKAVRLPDGAPTLNDIIDDAVTLSKKISKIMGFVDPKKKLFPSDSSSGPSSDEEIEEPVVAQKRAVADEDDSDKKVKKKTNVIPMGKTPSSHTSEEVPKTKRKRKLQDENNSSPQNRNEYLYHCALRNPKLTEGQYGRIQTILNENVPENPDGCHIC